MALVSARVADAGPIGYSVRADTGDTLWAIDLETGQAQHIRQLQFGAEGLAMYNHRLYAIDGYSSETPDLWDVTPPGTPEPWPAPPFGTPIGPTGLRYGFDAGLADDPTGRLFNIQGYAWYDNPHSFLYEIDRTTGASAYIGRSNVYADGLAINASGQAYALDAKVTDALYRVDLLTGAMTRVGGLGLGDTILHTGLAFDATGVLWAISTGVSSAPSQIHRIDTTTGIATYVSTVTVSIPGLGNFGKNGFQSLAIDTQAFNVTGISEVVVTPEPGTLTLVALGLGWMLRRHQRVSRRP